MSAVSELAPETFKQDFTNLKPLIQEEWPEVDTTRLEQTAGEYEQVVSLVAEHTEHTKALVKRQLSELHQIAAEEDFQGMEAVDGPIRKLQDTAKRMQKKVVEWTDYMRKQALTDAKNKASEHPLVTLLIAIGLGFILGFLARGIGRGNKE